MSNTAEIARERALDFEPITCLLLATRIEQHLADEEELRRSVERLYRESDMIEITKGLQQKTAPLLRSGEPDDVLFVIEYVARKAYQQGIRDGLFECEIQCLGLADKYSDTEPEPEEGAEE